MNPRNPSPLRRGKSRTITALCLLGLATTVYLSYRHTASESATSGQASSAPSRTESVRPSITASPALQGEPAAGQEGLWQAFEVARREIQPLSPEEATLPGNEGVTAFSYHPAQGLAARYAKEGVRFSGRDGETLGSFSYSASSAGAEWESSGIRAELDHGDGVTEWFENRSEGIEHGFIVSHPQATDSEALVIDVKLDGLTAQSSEDPEALALLADDGSPKLKYSGLKVWDANGATLTASMSPSAEGIAIRVNDRGARYPITIDPLITSLEETLKPAITGTGSSGDRFGISLAADGNAAVIGAASDTTAAGVSSGSAYIFEREGGQWIQKAILTPEVDGAGDSFGSAVAISGDIVVVGAPNDGRPGETLNSGSAYVFVRSGGSWTMQAHLADVAGITGDVFGLGVAAKGSTVLVQGKNGGGNRGAIYAYVQKGSAWELQKLLELAPLSVSRLRQTLAFDGTTVMVGVNRTNTDGVVMFTRTGETWSEALGLGPSMGGGSQFGVALSLEGDTLLVGAPDEENGTVQTGSAHIFTRVGGVWTLQQELIPADGVAGDDFGTSVVLAGDLAFIGQSGANPSGLDNAGAVNVYRRTGGVWSFVSKTVPQTPVANLRFGGVLARAGDQLLCGMSTAATAAGNSAGAVDVYNIANDALSFQERLTAGDESTNERFGYSVAIDGNTVAIGAAKDTTARGVEHGSAYVFTRSGATWTQQAKLSTNDGGDGLNFGSAVAVSDDTLIVGSPYDINPPIYNSAGAAYAYVRNGGIWTLQEKLYADAMEYGLFGSSIALDGDTAVIGAPTRGNRHGSAYVFTRSGGLWDQQATLEESPRRANAHFGSSLAIEGGTILVGAPQSGQHPGVAHVFTRSGSTWDHQAVLEGAGDLRFGTSVALSGNLALVGAPGSETLPDPIPGDGTGAAHLFARSGNTWNRVNRFTPESATAVHRFGKCVDIDGSIALVGAEERYTEGPDSDGATYVFAREGVTWSRQDMIAGLSEGATASALALSGDTAVVASSKEDFLNPFNGLVSTDTGSVRIYRLSGSLISGPDSMLMAAFDADGNGALSSSEWLTLYPAPPKKEKLFALADSDDSGEVSLAELIAASTQKATARTVSAWISRAKVFMELDADSDGQVTREEVALMWPPGTPPKAIDAFWSRAQGGSGLDLKEWVRTSVLPNFSTYDSAKATRAKRAEVAADLDSDDNGMITRTEFAVLFPQGISAKLIDVAWRAACGTPKKETPPAAITIEAFIESPKLPKLPN